MEDVIWSFDLPLFAKSYIYFPFMPTVTRDKDYENIRLTIVFSIPQILVWKSPNGQIVCVPNSLTPHGESSTLILKQPNS